MPVSAQVAGHQFRPEGVFPGPQALPSEAGCKPLSLDVPLGTCTVFYRIQRILPYFAIAFSIQVERRAWPGRRRLWERATLSLRVSQGWNLAQPHTQRGSGM